MRNKNKLFAAVAAFFGGTIGLHRWYLGDVGGGIFYLILMFITSAMALPVTTMLGVFEGIRLLMMSQNEFDRKYNGASRQRGQTQRGRQRQSRDRRTNRQFEERRTKARPQQKRKANPFKNSGIKKYKNFELDGAEKDLLEAMKINSEDIDTHYTLASIYSLSENKDKAYYHLQQAVDLGMKNLEKINTDDALAFLRVQDDFDEFKKSGFRQKRGSKTVSQGQEANLLEDDVLLSQLNKLAELRKRGLLSESEFTLERKKLLRK